MTTGWRTAETTIGAPRTRCDSFSDKGVVFYCEACGDKTHCNSSTRVRGRANNPQESPLDVVEYAIQDVPGDTEKIPFFTRDNLSVKTIVNLRIICSTWKIRPGKKKSDTIDAILARVSTVHRDFGRVEQLKQKLLIPSMESDQSMKLMATTSTGSICLIAVGIRQKNTTTIHHGGQSLFWQS